MKKTILMLVLVGVALAACKKDETYKFDGNAVIYLNGVEQPKFKSTNTQYSLKQIVSNEHVRMNYSNEYGHGLRTFYVTQRDTINNRLMMWATDILEIDGTLDYEFIRSYDIYLTLPNGQKDEFGAPLFDTCGYIPQSVIDNAREQIEALYAQERYDEIYELFHTAFTFYTCTGQEYKDIVANGGN